MWTSVLTAAALIALAAGDCKNEQKDYYEELGCKPAVVGDDGCPRSYDCSSISARSQHKCHYRGKEYNEGDKLQPDNHCLADCRCGSIYEENKLAFVCAHVECGGDFMGPPPPGCYRTYEHGKCCEVNSVCNQTSEQKASRFVCHYKTNQYQVGERFYPDDDSCLVCICQPGFDGSLVEPYCQKVKCSLELHSGLRIVDGCIPVYHSTSRCCPIGWRCPSESDTVVGVVTDSEKNSSDLQCQFGKVKMHVGEKLNPSSEWFDTECECTVPPHPLCIQKPSSTPPTPPPPVE